MGNMHDFRSEAAASGEGWPSFCRLCLREYRFMPPVPAKNIRSPVPPGLGMVPANALSEAGTESRLDHGEQT
jgi:hypothetical protein